MDRIKKEPTAWRWINVESMLFQRCVPAWKSFDICKQQKNME